MAGTVHGRSAGDAPPVVPQLPIIRTQLTGTRATSSSCSSTSSTSSHHPLSHHLLQTSPGRRGRTALCSSRCTRRQLHHVDDELVRPDTSGPACARVRHAGEPLMAVAIPQGLREYALMFTYAYSARRSDRTRLSSRLPRVETSTRTSARSSPGVFSARSRSRAASSIAGRSARCCGCGTRSRSGRPC